MPELPEVETTVQGIKKHTLGLTIQKTSFFRERLRYPLNPSWQKIITGQTIQSIDRRAKMILMSLDQNVLVWHLGMTGSLRISQLNEPRRKHDHIELLFSQKKSLRFHDPRRFGYLQCFENLSQCEQQFKKYGPEPLTQSFNADYLWQLSRNKKQCIKSFIMNQHIVVGVGNIYACEALFLAKISPSKPCGKISKKSYQILVDHIKQTLNSAIKQGGTTINDFENANAEPGYFQQSLAVYGKENESCPECGTAIKNKKIAQRSSFYCAQCQK